MWFEGTSLNGLFNAPLSLPDVACVLNALLSLSQPLKHGLNNPLPQVLNFANRPTV